MPTTSTATRCTEPGGNETVHGTGRRTAHQVMLDESGCCPWCGEGYEWDENDLLVAADTEAVAS